jgi:hypothetical protein
MVSISNQQREAAIKARDDAAALAAASYKSKLKSIESKNLSTDDYTCEQSLDLIISAMKEISNAPDNP